MQGAIVIPTRFPPMKFLAIAIGLMLVPDAIGVAQDFRELSAEQQEQLDQSLHMQHIMLKIMNVGHDKMLARELELIDEQIRELEPIGRDFRTRMFGRKRQSTVIKWQREFQTGDRNEAIEELQKLQDESHEICLQLLEQVDEVLLPHQRERIRQLADQSLMRLRSGIQDEFGTAIGAAIDLGLTDEEKVKLDDAIAQARKEYQKDLEKLRKRSWDNILESVPRNKRDEFRQMLGQSGKDN